MHAFWRYSDNMTLVGGIENIGDRAYFEHFDLRTRGINTVFQPGFSMFAGAELRY